MAGASRGAGGGHETLEAAGDLGGAEERERDVDMLEGLWVALRRPLRGAGRVLEDQKGYECRDSVASASVGVLLSPEAL